MTASSHTPDSPYAWFRLGVSVLLMTLGGAGMYSVSVVLPRVQQDFGVVRADASFPYTLTMLGFGIGGVLLGRWADRRGVARVVVVGGLGLGVGFVLAGLSPWLWGFTLAHGLLIGLLGTAATFAPLVADAGQWFVQRRGMALAICMSGNYVAGAIWPPVIQHFVDQVGWRQTYVGLGLFCMLAILGLAPALRPRPPSGATPAGAAPVAAPAAPGAARMGDGLLLGMPPGRLQGWLCVAGVACCVAMSMPQVHIVAYCSDLGYGAARGAQMLSLMLALGVASRLISGAISDRIGGLRTLLLGSVLQGLALLLFLVFDGPVSLFVVAGLFGLFQGGIVPAYALIVRELFPPQQAGQRTGTVLMATLVGMALGGWMSGAVFDWSGSYRLAFVNGLLWNALNLGVALWLLRRLRRFPPL